MCDLLTDPYIAHLRNSPTRHRREGLVLRKHGTARVLLEAEQAPDNRKRMADWRNRYAMVPLELTLPPIHHASRR